MIRGLLCRLLKCKTGSHMKVLKESFQVPHFDWDAPSTKGGYLRSVNGLPIRGAMRSRPAIMAALGNEDDVGGTEIIVSGNPQGQASAIGVGVGCGVTAAGLGVVVILSNNAANALTYKACHARLGGSNQDQWMQEITGAVGAVYDGTSSDTLVFDSIALNDKIIFTDGVGTPFMYDCTNETFTKLTDAPKAKRVTTYYQKVVFGAITEAGKQNRIEWSEEGDPETGYDATGYDNLWVFGQQDTGPVVAIEGTNDALYVFKRTSISAVRGPTEDAFTAAGTREGVSTEVGALGPYCTTIAEGSVIYFMSEKRELFALQPGATSPTPISEREDGSSGIRDWNNNMQYSYGGWNADYDSITLGYMSDVQMVTVFPTQNIAMDTYYGLLLDTQTQAFCEFLTSDWKFGGRSSPLRGPLVSTLFETGGKFPTIFLVNETGYTIGTPGIPVGCVLQDGVEIDFDDVAGGITEWNVQVTLWSRLIGRESPEARKLFTGLGLDVEARAAATAAGIGLRKYANQGNPPTLKSGTVQSGNVIDNSHTGVKRQRFGFNEYGVDIMLEISWTAGSSIAGVRQNFGVLSQVVDAITEFSF